MKIIGMSARLLAVDTSPRFGDEGIPAGKPSVWHYSLITPHTDECIDGYLHMPTQPGLGIEMDWDWINDHTVEIINSTKN